MILPATQIRSAHTWRSSRSVSKGSSTLQNYRPSLCPVRGQERIPEDCFRSGVPSQGAPCGVPNPARSLATELVQLPSLYRAERAINLRRVDRPANRDKAASEIGTLAASVQASALGERRQSTVADPPGLPVLPALPGQVDTRPNQTFLFFPPPPPAIPPLLFPPSPIAYAPLFPFLCLLRPLIVLRMTSFVFFLAYAFDSSSSSRSSTNERFWIVGCDERVVARVEGAMMCPICTRVRG